MISIGNLQINKIYLGDVEVTKAYLGDVEVYGSTPQPVGKYMTIIADESVGETVIKPNVYGSLPNLNLQYRINNGDWTDFIVGTTADIHLTSGNFVQFKGNNTSGLSTSNNNYLNFAISGLCHLSGNVMSLIDGVGDALEIPCDYCFFKLFSKSNVKTVSSDFLTATTLANNCYYMMFYRCSKLVNAPELPATTLAEWCYREMFSECTSLVNAPALPATTLADRCYQSMFSRCTSLMNAPALTATTIAARCYYEMFYGCTSLVSAPELPATTLAYMCYIGMFSGCSSLTTAPELPATTLSNYCYSYMFAGCTSLATAPALSATTITDYCYTEMFKGCTSLTTAPVLPATTLANSCYYNMFRGCTSLTTAPVLPATTLANSCYNSMFYGCSKLVNAPELPATTLAGSDYASMFYGCTSLTTAPVLPATTLEIECYKSMFSGCTSLTTAPELPVTTLANYCYQSMFSGCTALTTAPELPATTLAAGCYGMMFSGCSKLNYVKCLATEGFSITDNNGNKPLYQWLEGVAATGTFVKPVGISYETGISGIPSGWTVIEEKPKPEGKYMTITMDDSARKTSITPKIYGSLTPPNLQYRINNGSWNDFIFDTTSIIVQPGDFVQFKGVNESGISTSSSKYLNFKISELYHLSGNIMSLIDGVGETKVIPNSYCFYTLFSNSKVKTVSSDFLPATTLTEYCYYYMFYYCSSLETVPALPATTLADYCYAYMFNRCSKLVNAPALPATTLAEDCYSYMFYGTSLVKAPELPATTLVNNCYSNMFKYCSKLNYVKCLATDITATNALNQWLSGVAATGTFVKPAGVSYVTGDSGIPSGWTIEEIDAPTPPEPEGKYMTITVGDGANGTTITPTVNGNLPNLNLQYRINNGEWSDFIVGTTAAIKVVAGDVVQWKGNNPDGISDSYPNYLNFGISGNPVALSGNIMSLIDGVGETLVVPSAFCFSNLFYNSAIKTVSSDFLPATTLQSNCYRSLFSYCQILTQAPALPATTLEGYCYTEMFSGCFALKQAPELPAQVLVDSCYNYMFESCRSLNYVKCLAIDNISTSTISSWLSGVSSTGTFEKPTKAKYLNNSGSGIPSGWTVVNI